MYVGCLYVCVYVCMYVCMCVCVEDIDAYRHILILETYEDRPKYVHARRLSVLDDIQLCIALITCCSMCVL